MYAEVYLICLESRYMGSYGFPDNVVFPVYPLREVIGQLLPSPSYLFLITSPEGCPNKCCSSFGCLQVSTRHKRTSFGLPTKVIDLKNVRVIVLTISFEFFQYT